MSDLNSLTLNTALNEAVEWLTAAEYAQAIARCEDLLSSYPEAVRVLSVRARALQAMGEVARAAQDYARVLEIMPADHQSMAGLMSCQIRVGQRREAVITAGQLLDYDHSNVDAARLVKESGGDVSQAGRVLAARVKFAGGLTNRAISEMRAMVGAAPDRVDLQMVLAEMLWRTGLRITTTELCQAVLDTQPDCLNANVVLYALWSLMGSSDMSSVHLRAIERLDPDCRETVAWLNERSPLPIRDVPAWVEPSRRLTSMGSDDDERDRSEWVDQLIASVAPVSFPSALSSSSPEREEDVAPVVGSAVAVAAAVAAAAGISADLAAGSVHGSGRRAPSSRDARPEPARPQESPIVLPPAPLDWQHDEADGADEAEEAARDDHALPAWLSGLRQQSQPLSESDWDTVAPATPAGGSDEKTAQDSAEDQSHYEPVPGVLHPAMPLPAADMPAGIAPLEWQPVEGVEPAGTADTQQAPVVEESAKRADASARQDAGRAQARTFVAAGTRASSKVKARPKKDKASVEHLLSLARRSMDAADYDQAAQHYARLVATGKKLDEVQSDLDVATHAYPDMPKFHTLLGRVHTRKGDLGAALAAYQRALKLEN